MTDVTILHEAKIELFESIEYYENKFHGLGTDFSAAIESSIEMIKRFPELAPLCDDDTRRYLVNRFPYIIVYSYHDNHLWIIAIAHCKRKPGYWKERIKKHQ